MGSAETIDEVVQGLDEIIDWAWESKSRLGYFPALYRKVTLEVKKGIAEGFFDDGPRMERLDVTFANRYLKAFRSYREGTPLTLSWKTAFEAADSGRYLIIQHLLLGMNAHINLDLGIATAQVSPGPQIAAIEGDFARINQILTRLIGDVQQDINQLSPWFWFLDKIGGRSDEKFAKFSLKEARKAAWRVAEDLAALRPELADEHIKVLDGVVKDLARLLEGRGPITRPVVWLVRRKECKDVRRIIDQLR